MKRSPKSAPWRDHEKHVAALYQTLGYHVTHNVNVSGQQSDLLCERMLPGAGKTILYVDCKYTSPSRPRSVSKDEVTKFITNFHAMKLASGCSAGVIVSNVPFTQLARTAAAPHADVFLKTVDDLYADLFQIHAYLHACLATYQAESLFADYIPLSGEVVRETGLPSPTSPLRDIFGTWLHSSDNPQLCLLGDFGAGKTTFLRRMHQESAVEFLAGRFQRMPLFLQLRDYYDTRDIQELVERFFATELATKVPYHLFTRFLRTGHFLLFLDGFDEMGVASDSIIRRANYLKLCQLVTPTSKVVITCRPTYFVSHEEMLAIFTSYRRQAGFAEHPGRGDKAYLRPYTTLTKVLEHASQGGSIENIQAALHRASEQTEMAQIHLFGSAQVRSYLRAHKQSIAEASEGSLTPKTLFRMIQDIYDLEDLATRPILLKLIVRTLPLFRRTESNKYRVNAGGNFQTFDDITPSVLYYVYTEGELAREYEKGVRWQLERKQRREVIARLAFEMFSTGSLALDGEQLTDITHLHFQVRQQETLAQIVSNVRTCSFLTTDAHNTLRFAHKSFMEFYASMHLVGLLQTAAAARRVLGQRLLPVEILYFLGDLVGSFFPAVIRILKEIASAGGNTHARYNSLNLLNYSRHPPGLLEGVQIPALYYVKLTVESLELKRCQLDRLVFAKTRVRWLGLFEGNVGDITVDGGRINEATFREATVASIEWRGSRLRWSVEDSTLKACRFINAELDYVRIINSTMIAGASQDTTFGDVLLRNVLFMASDEPYFADCRIERLVFEKCIFMYVRISAEVLARAYFTDCIFVHCALEDAAALDRLDGSGGFFVQKGEARSARDRGRPFLLSADRVDGVLRTFRAGFLASPEEQRRKRLELLKQLDWEEVLAIAFAQRPALSNDVLTLAAARARLRQTREDLGALC